MPGRHTDQRRETSTQLHSESAIAQLGRSAAWVPMVSVGKLSAGQARYYLDQAGEPVSAADALATGAEDYYLGGPEAAGRWVGRGAHELGLVGHVGATEFQRLLCGGNRPRSAAELASWATKVAAAWLSREIEGRL
jgi:hypothetical protein